MTKNLGNAIPNRLFQAVTLSIFNGEEFVKNGNTYRVINRWFKGWRETYRVTDYDILDVTTGIVYMMAKEKVEKAYLDYKQIK